jgi:hypothetical protein
MTRVRPVGAAWVVFDHFALWIAGSGRISAAARVTGWNEATAQAKNVRRQLNERRAHESAMAILRGKPPAGALDRLLAEGARMREEQVCNLAVAPRREPSRTAVRMTT